MLHFTCDLCGKELGGDDHRFVVKIEAYPACDPAELTDADLDDDHMEAVSQLLQEMEHSLDEIELTDAHKKFRYDLCAECHKRFAQDPLNREAQKFDFSKN